MSEISVCIITKNEEKNLEKCLSKIRPYPFEIIVVDTGSTDNTKIIAEKYADAVYDFKWINDFSAARNFSISKASNDWILVLDSDEYVRELDYNGILQFTKDYPKTIGRLTRFSPDRVGSVTVDEVERLFDRSIYHYERTIHEQVMPIDHTPLTVQPIPLIVDHSGYVSLELAQQKAERNLSLLLEELKTNPKDAYTLFQIGQSYYMVCEYAKALPYFEKSFSCDVNPDADFVQLMLTSYVFTLLNLDKEDAAISFLEQVGPYFSMLSDYHYALGLCYAHKQAYIKALPTFIQALSAPKHFIQGTNSFLIFYQLGIINASIGHIDSARDFLQKASADYEPALLALEEIERQLSTK